MKIKNWDTIKKEFDNIISDFVSEYCECEGCINCHEAGIGVVINDDSWGKSGKEKEKKYYETRKELYDKIKNLMGVKNER